MAKAASASETPVMLQYRQAKQAHPDCLLLMRMGDFYELFFEDARTAAEVLGITLTARNKGAADEVPMAGVPWRTLDHHLPKLLAAGHKVAVMDQLEDPAQAKGLVKRGLTRIITAGTLIDEDCLAPAAPNFLVAVTGLSGRIGVAALDCSTGRFQVEDAEEQAGLALVLARLAPAELLVPEELAGQAQVVAGLCPCLPLPPVSTLPGPSWRAEAARRLLGEHLGVTSLEGFGLGPDDDPLARAAGAALRYAQSVAFQDLRQVRRLVRLHRDEHLVMDRACRRNLEILVNARDGGREGSLLAVVDRTRTTAGARLLADWLSRPLAQVEPISQRHAAVAALAEADGLRQEVRAILQGSYDLERLLTRVATARCHGRDLVQIALTVQAAERLASLLAPRELPLLLSGLPDLLQGEPGLAARIRTTMVDEPPLTHGEADLIRPGVDAELDQLRSLRTDAAAWMERYQADEMARTGLSRLKVGYNRVFGYFIELPKARGDQVPAHFIRKQTLVNAERYVTTELTDFEGRMRHADEQIEAIQTRIFGELCTAVSAALGLLQEVACALALLDVLAGLAELARTNDWCRPQIDHSLALTLEDSRHPVVEPVVGRGRFVANDVRLEAGAEPDGPGRLAVITGPNMAGKSTYIRQTALIVLLAQAGSFVPARQARIGVVDRLFTRVGAGDELVRGLSTFMVEMAETAGILNHATERSLVILDEVGRGTSTFDGLSLAWAVTEYLHDVTRCRCLFATHYHELTDLAEARSGVRNLSVAVEEADDRVVFLHRIAPGAARQSYGIHVAALAGVPPAVLRRAREVLATLETLNVDLLERERPEARAEPAFQQLTIFTPSTSPTLTKLRRLDLDNLTPRQAHDLLAELQKSARRE